MILSARYIKKPRRFYCCDWCGKSLANGYIYLYGGSPDDSIPMRAARMCPAVECTSGRNNPKIQAALKKAEEAADDDR